MERKEKVGGSRKVEVELKDKEEWLQVGVEVEEEAEGGF